QRCLEAGLVEGKRLNVDGTAVTANASPQSRVPREELAEGAKLSRTVREYLAEVGRENPVSDPGDRPPTPTSAAARWVSATDPEACWAGKGGTGRALLLRSLLDRQRPRDHPGRGSDAGALPTGDVGGTPDAGACEREISDLSRELGSRQSLWSR